MWAWCGEELSKSRYGISTNEETPSSSVRGMMFVIR